MTGSARARVVVAALAAALALVLAVPGVTAAAGPYDQAVAEGIDPGHTRFASGGSLDRPPLATRWSRSLGSSIGYPLIAGGRVFAVSRDDAHASATLQALDVASGATLWSRPVGHGAQLAYEDGRVYSLDAEGVASAFAADTGATLWTRYVFEPFDETAPVAAGGKVYVYLAWSGGALYALDGATGTIAWTNPILYDGGTPAVDGRHVYVHDGYACATAAASRATGATVWRSDFDCWNLRYWAAADGGHVAAGSGQLLDSSTGRLRDQVFGSPPALAGTANVALNGSTLQARNLRTGTTLWEFAGDGALASAPLVVNHVAYVGSGSGTLFAVDLHTGAPVWSAVLGSGTPGASGMAAAGGVLVVPVGGTLVALASASSLPRPGLDLRVLSGPDGPVTSSEATFAFTASGGGFTYACRLDRGAWQPCAGEVSYTGLSDGPHTFEVKTESAGGDVALAARSWSIASALPTVRVTSGPRALTREHDARFTLAAERAARIECRLDGGAWASCSETPSYWVYDGQHTFEARAVDAFGRTSDATPLYSWTVDTYAPSTTITGGPQGTTESTTATFSFTSSESGSSFACQLDGGAWAPCSSPHTVTVAPGSHTFSVHATDAAGNAGWVTSRSWTVSQPPAPDDGGGDGGAGGQTGTGGGTTAGDGSTDAGSTGGEPTGGGGTALTPVPGDGGSDPAGGGSGDGSAVVASTARGLRTAIVRGLRLVDAATLARQRTFLVGFSASEAGTLRIELRLRGGRSTGTLIARGARRMRAGESAFVRLRTTRAGQRALRRTRGARVKVVVRFVPAAGRPERAEGVARLARR